MNDFTRTVLQRNLEALERDIDDLRHDVRRRRSALEELESQLSTWILNFEQIAQDLAATPAARKTGPLPKPKPKTTTKKKTTK